MSPENDDRLCLELPLWRSRAIAQITTYQALLDWEGPSFPSLLQRLASPHNHR